LWLFKTINLFAVKRRQPLFSSPEIRLSALEGTYLQMAQTLNQISIRTSTRTPPLLLFPRNRTVATVATGAIKLEND
jgi:hypothetical protein